MNTFLEAFILNIPIIMVVIMIISLHFSKLNRSTIELSKLNRICERWLLKINNWEKDFSKEIEDLNKINWKFHREKADLFIKIYTLCFEWQKI